MLPLLLLVLLCALGSYVLFQVPSNMALQRCGARNWLGLMAVCWGLCCCALATSTDADSFYRWRFALGATEAGFFPGVNYFLRLFVPRSEFGFAYGLIVSATCLAMVVGGPFAALVAVAAGGGAPGGLVGWQWLFLAQGLPAVAIGLLLPCWLPGSPAMVNFGEGTEGDEDKRFGAPLSFFFLSLFALYSFTNVFYERFIYLFCFGLLLVCLFALAPVLAGPTWTASR